MSLINVLYVEDDPISREVMELLCDLELEGINLSMFEDSADFIYRLEKLPAQPDIFLLDIHIRPIDGFEMLDQIREHPDFKDAKVLALTASVMNEEVQTLKQAGFDGGIAKPIDAVDLYDIFSRVIAGEKVWHIT